MHLSNWMGRLSTWSKWCWTLSKDSDNPHHFSVDLSFWDKFDTLVQKQPMVRNCSKLLPAKPPFQQVEKFCKDLQLATPEFAHRDTYRKINQSVDSGLLWDVCIEKSIEKSSTSFLQIQTEKAFSVLEAWEVFVNASPAEPQLACHAKQPLGMPEITFKIFDDSCHCAKSPLAMQLGQRCPICEPNTWNQFYNLQTNHLSFSKLQDLIV